MTTDDKKRVLLPTDRYNGYTEDKDVPHLFGLDRRTLGVLAAPTEWIFQSRRIPAPIGIYIDDNDPPQYLTPIDNSNFPDESHLAVPRLEKGQTLEGNASKTFIQPRAISLTIQRSWLD